MLAVHKKYIKKSKALRTSWLSRNLIPFQTVSLFENASYGNIQEGDVHECTPHHKGRTHCTEKVHIHVCCRYSGQLCSTVRPEMTIRGSWVSEMMTRTLWRHLHRAQLGQVPYSITAKVHIHICCWYTGQLCSTVRPEITVRRSWVSEMMTCKLWRHLHRAQLGQVPYRSSQQQRSSRRVCGWKSFLDPVLLEGWVPGNRKIQG